MPIANREARNAYYREYMKTRPEQRARKQARNKKWSEANRAKCVVRTRRWQQKHIEQHKAYTARYRQANAEVLAKRTQAYHQANPDKCRKWEKSRALRIKASEGLHEKRKQSQRDYYARNAEKRKAQVRQYAQNNPERVRMWGRIATTRRRNRHLVGRCNTAQWLARCAYYGWCCAYCHKALNYETVERDHVKAVARGGSEWPSNAVPSCATCNMRKHMKRWIPHPIWAKPKELN